MSTGMMTGLVMIAAVRLATGPAGPAGNAAEREVVTLPSGLAYEVLEEGRGTRPTLADTVVVRYRERGAGGAEHARDGTRTGTFPVRAALPGLREALLLMPSGARWRIAVPPHLAHGARDAGRVAPGVTRTYEVELVSVKGRGRVGAPAAVGEIEMSFKLDPRLTRSLYMGDRWVSPSRFTVPPRGKTSTVTASARGVLTDGRRVEIDPEWIPADSDMVEIAKGRGGTVDVTVKRPGETRITVAFEGIEKAVLVKASERGGALVVELSQ